MTLAGLSDTKHLFKIWMQVTCISKHIKGQTWEQALSPTGGWSWATAKLSPGQTWAEQPGLARAGDRGWQ